MTSDICRNCQYFSDKCTLEEMKSRVFFERAPMACPARNEIETLIYELMKDEK
jgi:hypothetical protein